MPTWSPAPTPWAARWWASRFARSSISLYVRRLRSQTTYSRSPKWSAAFSKRSARLNSTAPRLEHVLIGRQTLEMVRAQARARDRRGGRGVHRTGAARRAGARVVPRAQREDRLRTRPGRRPDRLRHGRERQEPGRRDENARCRRGRARLVARWFADRVLEPTPRRSDPAARSVRDERRRLERARADERRREQRAQLVAGRNEDRLS